MGPACRKEEGEPVCTSVRAIVRRAERVVGPDDGWSSQLAENAEGSNRG
jgi:hypothetical protein